MSRLSKSFGYSLVLAACASLAGVARADTVNLLSFGNVNWNISTSPATSPAVTIQIQNAASSSDLIFNGYDLGFEYIRTAGSGSLTLSPATTNPDSPSIISNWVGQPAITNYFSPPCESEDTINNVSSASTNYVVPNTPTNLVKAYFEPAATAPTVGSVFQVWSDFRQSDYFNYAVDVTATNYANNVSSNFLLGTITIVPEPGTLVLLCSGGLALLFLALRRRATAG